MAPLDATVTGMMVQGVSVVLLLAGLYFFIAGTVGLLRFPDIFSRLHAVTKADTVGLGLVVAGLALRSDNWRAVFLLVLIWVLVMASGAVACQLYARFERERQDSGPGGDS